MVIRWHSPARWVLIGIIILSPFISISQSPDPIRFNHFSADHGLSQSVFMSVLQDSKGYMWFGAENGLLKFDGHSFTTFQADPLNKKALPTNYENQLCEDGKGNIWIAGDYCISKYNTHNGIFTTWRHDAKNRYSLPSDNVSCLATDPSGIVWIGTNDAGLCFYDELADRFIPLRELTLKDSLISRNIQCLMIDHHGLLWIGTATGMNIYDIVHKKLTRFNPADNNHFQMNDGVSCLLEDHTGEIWYSVNSKGVSRYNPSTGLVKQYVHDKSKAGSLSSNVVNSMMEDSHHNIWMGGYGGGISIYQRASDNFNIYRAKSNENHGLSSDQILKFFEDKSGVIWIATNGGGLNTCYPNGKKFMVYQNWDKEFISHRPISLFKDRRGKIYMTALESGVMEFNPAEGNFKSYKIVLPNDALSATNSVYGLLETTDSILWGVSFAEGIFTLDRKTGKFTIRHSESGSRDTSSHNIYNCLVEGPNKKLWIGSNYGLKCYDPQTKKINAFEELYRDTNFLSSDAIASLYLDDYGIMWIAGTKGGMTSFDLKTGALKVFRHDDQSSLSITSNSINCIYPDEYAKRNGQRKLWIGTDGGGLNEFDPQTGKFKAYMMKEGLPDNSVRGILSDDHGNLWLSTNKGISRFTPPDERSQKPVCRNFNMSDGLPGSEFYYNTALKGNDGSLYFACLNGLIVFKPEELKDNPFIPPVVITDFSLMNKSVSPLDTTGILKLPVDETRELILNHSQNQFSFSFAVLNYVHPEKNQYAYRLEGFDKEWISAGAERPFANYTNLNAGTYVFKVKASNNDGIWNEEGTAVRIIIKPPWWNTWWFTVCCVISVAAAGYAIYFSRMRKFRDIRRIRNKIASDLHDDLGATLSSISIMSELVNQQVKGSVPEAAPLLEKIGKSSRDMIESVNDMVWAINPKNDSFENIIKRMRTFASDILAAKDIAFHFDFDKNLLQSKLKMDVRRNFYLIFKEAVNNTAKYSGAANAFIMIWNRENNLKMTIRDDGNGFESSSVKAGNGLQNMQHRADGIKARFQMESIPGKGTTIELELKSDT